MGNGTKERPTVENRWWAEIGRSKDQPPAKSSPAPVGARLFKAAEGYDQDQAREALTDINLRLLSQGSPAEGAWGYVQLVQGKSSQGEVERLKRAVQLPPYARGVIVDSGRGIRVLITGTPPGERIIELDLIDKPTFDFWIGGEWIRDETCRNKNEALAKLQRRIRGMLSPEAIAESEANAARA